MITKKELKAARECYVNHVICYSYGKFIYNNVTYETNIEANIARSIDINKEEN